MKPEDLVKNNYDTVPTLKFTSRIPRTLFIIFLLYYVPIVTFILYGVVDSVIPNFEYMYDFPVVALLIIAAPPLIALLVRRTFYTLIIALIVSLWFGAIAINSLKVWQGMMFGPIEALFLMAVHVITLMIAIGSRVVIDRGFAALGKLVMYLAWAALLTFIIILMYDLHPMLIPIPVIFALLYLRQRKHIGFYTTIIVSAIVIWLSAIVMFYKGF